MKILIIILAFYVISTLCISIYGIINNPSWKHVYFKITEILNEEGGSEEKALQYLKKYKFARDKCLGIIEACKNGDEEWVKNNF